MALKYVPKAVDVPIMINPADVEDGMKKWCNVVLGFPIGSNLPYQVVKRFADCRWKGMGKVEISSLKNSIFVFNFETTEMKARVLEQSPWSMASKMFFLKPWRPDLDLKKEDFDSIPVWARFPLLKLHYYTEMGMSNFVSHIGQPLYTDKCTASREIVGYAGVYVGLQAGSDRPSSIPYMNVFGIIEE